MEMSLLSCLHCLAVQCTTNRLEAARTRTARPRTPPARDACSPVLLALGKPVGTAVRALHAV